MAIIPPAAHGVATTANKTPISLSPPKPNLWQGSALANHQSRFAEVVLPLCGVLGQAGILRQYAGQRKSEQHHRQQAAQVEELWQLPIFQDPCRCCNCPEEPGIHLCVQGNGAGRHVPELTCEGARGQA